MRNVSAPSVHNTMQVYLAFPSATAAFYSKNFLTVWQNTRLIAKGRGETLEAACIDARDPEALVIAREPVALRVVCGGRVGW